MSDVLISKKQRNGKEGGDGKKNHGRFRVATRGISTPTPAKRRIPLPPDKNLYST